MGNVGRTRRAGKQVVDGRRRAAVVAQRLGVALRDARQAAGMLQRDVAAAAGLSQPRLSELERGHGARASIETWACAASANGEQFVGFLELAAGATPPRDIEHLRRQSAVIDYAKPGGWQAMPEFAIDPGAIRSRSIDVVLLRRETHEAVLVEIWDWFDDVGAALRSLDGKRDAFSSRLSREGGVGKPWIIRCLFIVRRTRRNERLIHDLGPLFAARFRAPAPSWLRALGDPSMSMPAGDALLWSTAKLALQASRLPRS
jgi:transcriptional regulator with XRE-family HTH domain